MCTTMSEFETMYCSKFLLVVVTLVAFVLLMEKIGPICGEETFNFDRQVTGVNFIPYVKTPNSEKSFSCAEYTFQELKTMLEVVSTKFSRLVTGSMDALDVEYTPETTYYNDSCIITRTAEAAAVINQERNATHLEIIIGVKLYNDKEGGERRTETEVNLALEAFQIAQAIYPGTVEGFQLSGVLTDTQSAINGSRWLDHIKDMVHDTGKSLRFGVIDSLSTFEGMDLSEDAIVAFHDAPYMEKEPRFSLIAKLDFITIKFFADTSQAFNSPAQIFAFRSPFLQFYLQVFERIKRKYNENYPDLIMGYSGWSNEGDQSYQNIKNMKKYWIAMNEYAVKNNLRMWFHEAFDNPWKANLEHDSPYYGWWRLTDDRFADNVSAYVENVLNPRNITRPSRNPETITTNTVQDTSSYIWVWSAIAVIVGGLIIMTLLISLLKLQKKRASLQNFVLSKKEIQDFKFGISDKDIEIAEHGGEVKVCGSAMQKPYDRSLEIPIDKMEIYWERILGAGQFNSVHMALIKGQSPKEVALKTTKIGCSSNALRGLLSEIKILTHLGQHPNVVSICGAYTSELSTGKIYVALELCTMGSLKRHLMTSYTMKMTQADDNDKDETDSCLQENLLRWSYEIAAGMEHVGNKGVIHADLATRNVLLTSSGTAKIADFGLSRRLYEYAQYVKKQEEPLPWRWMAIESLKRRQFSFKSDVWSFGVTLWEIFSLGLEPYPGNSYNAEFIENLESGLLRMHRPSEATSEIYQVMLACWHLQPDMRPNFTTLKTTLLEISNGGIYDVLTDANV